MAIFGKRKALFAQIAAMGELVAASSRADPGAIAQAKNQLLGVEPHDLLGSIRVVALQRVPPGLLQAPGLADTLRTRLTAQSDIPQIQEAVVRIGLATILNGRDTDAQGVAVEETFKAAVDAGNEADLDMRRLPFFMIAEAFGETLAEMGLGELMTGYFGDWKLAP